jgi:hypothetical protein
MQKFKGDKPSEETVAENSGESVPFLMSVAGRDRCQQNPYSARRRNHFTTSRFMLCLWTQYISKGNKELLIVHKIFCPFSQHSFTLT